MKAWITGAGGLIGQALLAAPPPPGWTVRGLRHEELELTDYTALRRWFHREQPEVIIHAAALSRPAVCQADPGRAWAVNTGVTALLADLAAERPFIFLSSEQVFDGRGGPYAEDAPVHPINVYGETKVEAERRVLAHPRHTVVRLALVCGHSREGTRAFNEEWVNRWRQGQALALFTDEIRCPIPAPVVAEALWCLAAANAPGLYHLAGAEALSRWEIGRLLAGRVPGAPALIRAGTQQEWQGPPRPPALVLTCARLARLLPRPLPRFSEWLAREDRHPAPPADEAPPRTHH